MRMALNKSKHIKMKERIRVTDASNDRFVPNAESQTRRRRNEILHWLLLRRKELERDRETEDTERRAVTQALTET